MTARRWRFPLFLSGLILLSQAFPLPSPVRDAATLQGVTGFTMHYPLGHLLFTPFCGLADVLTVLSYHQGIVMGIWVVTLFFILGGWRRGGVCFFLLLVFVAWGALIPRPMGRLVAGDPDVLLIDFHSHTRYSHDGRPMFTPERNMAWHRDQGYAASFITDHNRVEASQIANRESEADWPKTGYRSLQGEEVSLQKTHLIILGSHEKVDNRPYDGDFAKIPGFVADMHKKNYPVIASLPEYWLYHWGAGVQDFVKWGMDGFEIVNSAPKALDFPPAYRVQIVDLCRSQNLFMTGISDNHGYGYATAVWNAMTLPGWQSLGSEQLEKAVLLQLKTKRFHAVQVLERVKFFPETSLQLAFSPLGTFWIYWRSLQPVQAIAWVVWLWLISFLYPDHYEVAKKIN